LRGRNTQLQNELRQAQETLANEKARLQAEIAAEKARLATELQTAQAATSAALHTVEELQPKVALSSEKEAELANLQRKAAKQDALMKFPSLLGTSVVPLVYSSNLEGETLDTYLQSLAGALGSKAPPVPGEDTSPTPPVAPEIKAADLFIKSEEARAQGDMVEYDKLYREHLRALDKEKGLFQPRIVSQGGDFPEGE